MREFVHVFGRRDHIIGIAGAATSKAVEGFGDDLQVIFAARKESGSAGSQVAAVRAAACARGWSPSLDARVLECPSGTVRLNVCEVATGAAPWNLVLLRLDYGDPPLALRRRLSGLILEHAASLLAADPRVTADDGAEAASETPEHLSPATIEAALSVLGDARFIVYVGAGASAASGIRPFAGSDGLEPQVLLNPLGDTAVMAALLDAPMRLADQVLGFQNSLSYAAPNAAHHALAALEASGSCAVTATANFDQLLTQAGVINVVDIRALTCPVPPDARTLLVAGVSRDEFHVVAAARSQGLRVLAIDPSCPAFLQPDDTWLRSRAEQVLPQLLDRLQTRRVANTPNPKSPVGLLKFPLDRLVSIPTVYGLSWRSTLHGEAHARRVALNGLALAECDARVDRAVVVAFAILHDAMRFDDEGDPGHGERAARWIGRFGPDLDFLDAGQLAELQLAIHAHSGGEITEFATIGACWDADRLDLWRCGLTPDPALMSTRCARDPAFLRRSRLLLGRAVTWNEVAHCLARSVLAHGLG